MKKELAEWESKDNSMVEEKAELRRRFLPEEAHVLDLFCGTGQMYDRAYKGRVTRYFGVDREKAHDMRLCAISDNQEWVRRNDIAGFNVFDLDDYGSPWPLLYLLLKELGRSEENLTIYLTDGLVIHQKLTGAVTRWVSATERLPRKMNVPGINRFYLDIFGTMLLDMQRRFGRRVERAAYFQNRKRTVYYWYLHLTTTT